MQSRSQIYWEDVVEGQDLPSLTKEPGSVQLAMYSAITGIFHRIHYDAPFAEESDGLPGVLVHGPLHGAFLCQMVTDWMGPKGFVRKLETSNRGMAVAGERLTCYGAVSKKFREADEHLVQCELWEENEKGEKITIGSATVRLPLRA
ncbi:MAG: acyl dehydratase [Chloroflexi bacterium]|nr:acyl dehydratase [Chloroflexota bacterium]